MTLQSSILPDLAMRGLRPIRALVLSDGVREATLDSGLRDLGCEVEVETDLFAAIEAIQGSATGFGLFVVDWGALVSRDAAHRMVALIGPYPASMRIILVTDEGSSWLTGWDPDRLILLKAPISTEGLRRAFSRAVQHRMVWPAP